MGLIRGSDLAFRLSQTPNSLTERLIQLLLGARNSFLLTLGIDLGLWVMPARMN